MACRFETTFPYLVDLSCKVELGLHLMPLTRNNFYFFQTLFSTLMVTVYRTFRAILSKVIVR